jgi:hypothetical protein
MKKSSNFGQLFTGIEDSNVHRRAREEPFGRSAIGRDLQLVLRTGPACLELEHGNGAARCAHEAVEHAPSQRAL